MQTPSSVRKKKVVVASSVAISVDELIQEEAAKSHLTASSLIRLFIHEGLQSRGIELPDGVVEDIGEEG